MSEFTNLKTYYFPPSGKSFIRLPRDIVNRLYHCEETVRQSAWLYFTLLVHCYHSDGVVSLGKLKVPCEQGEYVGSYNRLSRLTRLSASSVGRMLRNLSNENLIVIRHFNGGSRIRILGYQEITHPAKKKETEPTAAQSLAAYEDKLINQIMGSW